MTHSVARHVNDDSRAQRVAGVLALCAAGGLALFALAPIEDAQPMRRAASANEPPLSSGALRPTISEDDLDETPSLTPPAPEPPPTLSTRRIAVAALGDPPGLRRAPLPIGDKGGTTSRREPPLRVVQLGDDGLARELTILDAELDASGRLTVSGTGAAGAAVRLFIDAEYLATALVGPDGRWRTMTDRRSDGGEKTLRVDEIDRVSASVIRSAERRIVLPTPPSGVARPSGPRQPPRLGDGAETVIVNGGVTPNLTTFPRPAIRDPDGYPDTMPLPAAADPAASAPGAPMRRKF